MPHADAVKKQFIAGAVCPACKQQDSVRRCEDAMAVIWLDCIACGYEQDLTQGYAGADEPAAGGEKEAAPVTWRPR